jgi:hypothetical protein
MEEKALPLERGMRHRKRLRPKVELDRFFINDLG